MPTLQDAINKLIEFRDERDWKQFHDSKNLAAAISIEASELNELFLWKDSNESEKVDIERLKEELADVLAFAFLLAEKHNLDIVDILLEKIKKNEKKYSIEKSKGSSAKYTDFD